MDIQKERQEFELLPDIRGIIQDGFQFNSELNQYFHLDHVNHRLSYAFLMGAWQAWLAAKARAVPEGFVLVPKDQFESLNEFKGLYKRAIINARKRKDQLNWAHVAGLGVGSGRAVELCKMLNIDPGATNMHEVIEAQEQGHV